jgi:hypothetical protein
MMRANKPLGKELVGLLLHSLMAGIIGSFAAFSSFVIVGLLFSAIGFPLPSLGLVLNPLIWIPAGLVGFAANSSMQHRSACLVGVIGAIFLFLIMRSEVSLYERSGYYTNLAHGHYWRYAFQKFFSSDDRTCSDSECLEKVLFTLPFLASVAYSIGAWLSLKFPENKSSLQSEG